MTDASINLIIPIEWDSSIVEDGVLGGKEMWKMVSSCLSWCLWRKRNVEDGVFMSVVVFF